MQGHRSTRALPRSFLQDESLYPNGSPALHFPNRLHDRPSTTKFFSNGKLAYGPISMNRVWGQYETQTQRRDRLMATMRKRVSGVPGPRSGKSCFVLQLLQVRRRPEVYEGGHRRSWGTQGETSATFKRGRKGGPQWSEPRSARPLDLAASLALTKPSITPDPHSHPEMYIQQHNNHSNNVFIYDSEGDTARVSPVSASDRRGMNTAAECV